jgi:hypothetical protein
MTRGFFFMDGAFRRETMELFCFCHNYITPEKGLQAGKQSKKKKSREWRAE